ncbi:probable serine/threonine-protein kinase fhkB, partial [Chironomus tepperi]
MPEKITKSSTIHQDYDDESETSEALDEYEEYEEKNDDDDVEESCDDSGEELKDIGELLGFRVTGGKDFFMPITIFHVKENSRAEKANLKLGDAILSINGRDTEDMTLVQANRYLGKVAGGDVTLQVAKFDANEDDEDVQTIEEVVLEGPVSLQQKLRQMQQQLLSTMTDIPPQIQSKLAMVTTALEQFMTMDPDTLESSWNHQNDENVNEKTSSMEREASYENEKQFSTIEEEEVDEDEMDKNFEHIEMDENLSSTRETSYSFEDLAVDDDDRKQHENGNDDDDEDDYENCEDESICESIKSEEMIKLDEEKRKKNEKIQTLQKSWQKLCENQKTIH